VLSVKRVELKKEGVGLYGLLLISGVLLLLPKEQQSILHLHLDDSLFHGWQWFTCHVVHLNVLHWLGNAATLILLQQWYGTALKGKQWLLPSVTIAVLMPLLLVLFSEQLRWYAGLSGLLTGLFAYSSIVDRSYKPSVNIACWVIISSYAVVLCLQGEISRGVGSVPVASYSHLYSLMIGSMAGLGYRAVRSEKSEAFHY
jgi:membrane associated rhomboid family serine protease